nr:hypothetical protein [Tanacetum cinerariifolium]
DPHDADRARHRAPAVRETWRTDCPVLPALRHRLHGGPLPASLPADPLHPDGDRGVAEPDRCLRRLRHPGGAASRRHAAPAGAAPSAALRRGGAHGGRTRLQPGAPFQPAAASRRGRAAGRFDGRDVRLLRGLRLRLHRRQPAAAGRPEP